MKVFREGNEKLQIETEPTHPGSCSVFVLRAYPFCHTKTFRSGLHCACKYSLALLNAQCVVKDEVKIIEGKNTACYYVV